MVLLNPTQVHHKLFQAQKMPMTPSALADANACLAYFTSAAQGISPEYSAAFAGTQTADANVSPNSWPVYSCRRQRAPALMHWCGEHNGRTIKCDSRTNMVSVYTTQVSLKLFQSQKTMLQFIR
jgi:hypothetical protein